MILRRFKSGEFGMWVILSVALLLPFMPKLLSILIGLLILLFLLHGSLKANLIAVYQNKVAFTSVILYLFYVFALLWSDNISYGWLDLQIKLSLLIFPVVYSGSFFPEKLSLYKVLLAFCSGCFIALTFCLINALVMFPETRTDGFFYQKLSIFMHPGYFAMYLNLCICFLIHEMVFKEGIPGSKYRSLLFPVTVFLIIGILLLSSKAGILILLLTLFVTILYLVLIRKSGKMLISLILVLLGAMLFTFSAPETFKRWSEMSSTISGENLETEKHTTGLRLQTWTGALMLIKDHPLTGVGTGDVKDALVGKYKDLGFHDLVLKRLNAHNQFLQTTVALGVAGFILLGYLLYSTLMIAIKQKNYLSVVFVLIILFNAMIESILEVQAGVIFFAFFSGIFNAIDARKPAIQS